MAKTKRRSNRRRSNRRHSNRRRSNTRRMRKIRGGDPYKLIISYNEADITTDITIDITQARYNEMKGDKGKSLSVFIDMLKKDEVKDNKTTDELMKYSPYIISLSDGNFNTSYEGKVNAAIKFAKDNIPDGYIFTEHRIFGNTIRYDNRYKEIEYLGEVD